MNVPALSTRVTLEDLRDAARGQQGVAVRTSLVEVPDLSGITGHPVFLKLENEQPSGAFKLRGAWNALRRLPLAARRSGVITYSSGNHGQAVAFAAHRLETRAVIVMPETAPEAKVAGVRRWGGEVEFAGTTSEDRYGRAMALVAEHGFTVIPPFDHPDVIAGQGTVALEIVEDLPEVAHVVFPVGGGGLGAGISTGIAALAPTATVWAVEPEGSAAYAAALAAGRPVRLESTASVADGLLPLSVGDLTFAHMAPHARSVTVTDAAIVAATRWLYDEAGILAEPSGAATTAALRSGAVSPDGPAVLVVSGGNVDVSRLPLLEPVA